MTRQEYWFPTTNAVLIHCNIKTLRQTFENNTKILDTLMETIPPEKTPDYFHTLRSFRADVQTHVSLLSQISDPIKNNILSKISIDTK